MYIGHVGYRLTFTEVGELFERDRTTVAHGCQRVEKLRDNVDFDESIVLLELIVRALSGVQQLEGARDG
jgi:chromosomal replication initiation ATPase DnaA